MDGFATNQHSIPPVLTGGILLPALTVAIIAAPKPNGNHPMFGCHNYLRYKT